MSTAARLMEQASGKFLTAVVGRMTDYFSTCSRPLFGHTPQQIYMAYFSRATTVVTGQIK